MPVVGEEKYLDDKTLHDLREFKEKIVGREFEILPDIEIVYRLLFTVNSIQFIIFN